MSRIRANKFVNRTASGAPELTYGASIPVGYGITGAGGINLTGVITATSFSGSVTGAASTAATVDILNTNGLSTVYYPTFVESRSEGQIVRADVDLTYRTDTNTLTVPNVSATTLVGSLTGNATGLSGAPNIVVTNATVNGTLSVGGTSVVLNAQQLQIADRDIVVGYTTNSSNIDVSTDTTANHGGVSVASTEGSPLINIPIQSGINSNPSTYKQFMWVKQGNYAGLGTDTWITNYPISIGNISSVQNGSRLTVGTGFTVFDTYLDITGNINVSGDINISRDIVSPRNINATGIITASSFRGDGSQLQGVTAGLTLRQSGTTIAGGAATTINFVGPTITTVSGGIATITVTSGGISTEAATPSNTVTTLDLSKQDHKVTATGIVTVTCSGGTEGDSHTLRIVNSGIATVGFSTYFLFPSGSAPVLPTTSGAISIISFTVHRVGTAGTQLLAGASLNFS